MGPQVDKDGANRLNVTLFPPCVLQISTNVAGICHMWNVAHVQNLLFLACFRADRLSPQPGPATATSISE